MPATAEHLDVNLNRGRRAHWWRRTGSKETGFRYVDEHGTPVSKAAQERIQHLAIPPAWTNVRVAPSARARLQALGVDGGGRLQYLYHPNFRKLQDRHKFERVEHFGELLGKLRKQTSLDIAEPGLGRRKVMAVVVRLVNSLYFRVGSEEGVERYRTFGITTLRKHHLKIEDDGTLLFKFDGKHHVRHRRVLVDAALAEILKQLRQLKGTHLFQWVDEEGGIHEIHGRELNDYVKELTAPEYSAKDFRTWHGTLLVAQELAKLGPAESQRQRKRNLAQAVRNAAAHLGNTPAVCKRSYLHPQIVSLYERGITLVDVPLDPGRITAQQTEPVVEEMQLLELFHVGRVLEAKGKRSRGRVVVPKASGPIPVPPPRWSDAVPASSS